MRAYHCGFRVQGLGFRVQGLGFRVYGLGFRVQGLGFRVQGLGLRVQPAMRAYHCGFRQRRYPSTGFRQRRYPSTYMVPQYTYGSLLYGSLLDAKNCTFHLRSPFFSGPRTRWSVMSSDKAVRTTVLYSRSLLPLQQVSFASIVGLFCSNYGSLLYGSLSSKTVPFFICTLGCACACLVQCSVVQTSKTVPSFTCILGYCLLAMSNNYIVNVYHIYILGYHICTRISPEPEPPMAASSAGENRSSSKRDLLQRQKRPTIEA